MSENRKSINQSITTSLRKRCGRKTHNKMKYDNAKINAEFEKNLEETKQALTSLSFCQTAEVDKLLKGWVFEQTIVKCLQKEFNGELKIEQQFKFSSFDIQDGQKSRGTADLAIDCKSRKLLVEIKHSGIFDKEGIEKHKKYRKLIEDNGFQYLYLSKSETYEPYAEKYREVFGKENVFLLDVEGDWKRFIELINNHK